MHKWNARPALRSLRSGLKWTQEGFAEKVGLSSSLIAKVEIGKRRLPLETAEGIAQRVKEKVGAVVPDVQTAMDALIRVARSDEELYRALREADNAERAALGSDRLPPVPMLKSRPVGRDDEIRVIRTLLAERGKVLALVGDPAIGKTTVAKEVIARFLEDGRQVLFADAREGDAASPEEIEGLVWRSLLNRRKAGNGAERLNRVRRALARHNILLVLDNLDSVKDFDAVLSYVSKIGRSAAVLLTSRRHIPNHVGQNFILRELAPLHAARLFRQIGTELTRREATDEEENLIRLICGEDCLNGHPGAIEIAAALWRSWPLPEILSGLRERAMETLVDPLRSDLNRSMRLSIGLSYDLLARESAPACELFPRLAAFKASFDLQAVKGVCELTQPLPVLDALVTRSLVRFDGKRYNLHAVIREYGSERLADDRAYFELRAARYYAGFARRHKDDFRRLAEENGNLFAMAEWCEDNAPGVAPRFFTALITLTDGLDSWELLIRRANWLLQLAEDLALPEVITTALLTLGRAHSMCGAWTEARKCANRLTAIALERHDFTWVGAGHSLLAQIALDREELGQARRSALDAIRALRRAKAEKFVPAIWSLLSKIEGRDGNAAQAYAWGDKALAFARHSGHIEGAHYITRFMARLAISLRDFERAKRYIQECDVPVGDTRTPIMNAILHGLRGELALEQEEWNAARTHLLAALPVLERHDVPAEVGRVLSCLGTACVQLNDLACAGIYYDRYIATMRELGNREGIGFGLLLLGATRYRQGMPDQARMIYQEYARLLAVSGAEAELNQ
jgi:transcriptional regulator with XRE-family HTH domain